jgi:lipopolysaccharide/colanic/teichoic acid biosynthesis glycosyltransferase
MRGDRVLDQIEKRIMDVMGAILGLLFTAFVYLPIAVAIKLDSPGPIFFAHERVGKGLHSFKCYKFRTMYMNSSGHGKKPGPTDERVTRVGRFLRSTSLDELPQFFNILRGEMRLVGPRPIVQEEVHYYGNEFELYASVPPGLTGLWQVSGRNNVWYPERVWLDAYYVRNWSIWLDLYILIKTPSVVLKRDGAY